MEEDKNKKQYFVHKGVKIIITEHFNKDGKCFEDIIKDAIIRDARTVAREQNITKN